MATRVEQAQIGSSATRNLPITAELERILEEAARIAGIDRVRIGSGGQPAYPKGPRTGSTRHDLGRAADFKLYQGGAVLTFTDRAAPPAVIRFIRECARLGATGIGAAVEYMGNQTFHVGFGLNAEDRTRLVWGEGGKSATAPQWLRDAAGAGWSAPPPTPRSKPSQPQPTVPPAPPREPQPSDILAPGAAAGGAAVAAGAGITNGNGWLIGLGALVLVAAVVFILIRRRK
jgi:hypothetical protein